MRGLVVLPALALAALAAGGCEVDVGGGDTTASGADIAENIRGEYERRTSIALEQLSCEEAEGERGAPIRCTGTNARDIDVTISGEVTDVEDDEVRFDWRVAEAHAPGQIFAVAAQRRLEQEVGQQAKDLTCPPRIQLRRGAEVRCELATLDGLTFGVTLTLTDDEGGFEAVVDDGSTTGRARSERPD